MQFPDYIIAAPPPLSRGAALRCAPLCSAVLCFVVLCCTPPLNFYASPRMLVDSGPSGTNRRALSRERRQMAPKAPSLARFAAALVFLAAAVVVQLETAAAQDDACVELDLICKAVSFRCRKFRANNFRGRVVAPSCGPICAALALALVHRSLRVRSHRPRSACACAAVW